MCTRAESFCGAPPGCPCHKTSCCLAGHLQRGSAGRPPSRNFVQGSDCCSPGGSERAGKKKSECARGPNLSARSEERRVGKEQVAGWLGTCSWAPRGTHRRAILCKEVTAAPPEGPNGPGKKNLNVHAGRIFLRCTAGVPLSQNKLLLGWALAAGLRGAPTVSQFCARK